MLHEDQLVSELKELNNYLEKRHRVGGTTGERRQQAEQKGVFAPLSGLSGKEISSFFQGRPLVGVDGSLATYGASYPYVVTFFGHWLTQPAVAAVMRGYGFRRSFHLSFPGTRRKWRNA
ncbi:MAG: hypothetical protein RQM95_11160 [Syntrophaceticus schinkii]